MRKPKGALPTALFDRVIATVFGRIDLTRVMLGSLSGLFLSLSVGLFSFACLFRGNIRRINNAKIEVGESPLFYPMWRFFEERLKLVAVLIVASALMSALLFVLS